MVSSFSASTLAKPRQLACGEVVCRSLSTIGRKLEMGKTFAEKALARDSGLPLAYFKEHLVKHLNRLNVFVKRQMFIRGMV